MLSMELLSNGIRVNAVAPGIIATDMEAQWSEEGMRKMLDLCDMHRPGSPEEVANVIAFLASDISSGITGQIIRVDGGMR